MGSMGKTLRDIAARYAPEMVPLFEIRDMTISLTRLPANVHEAGRPEERIVIEGASIVVGEGEAVALVGESGSGKSLLAMASVDLLGPGARVSTGHSIFEGHVLQELEDADWRALVGMGIGVLLQDAIGSWDPLDFIGWQSGEALMEHTELDREEVQIRVLDALGDVGLSERRHFSAFAHEMSRGQAQRGMLASALLSAPRLLIADEPLSGLDVTVARAVLDLIDDMRAKRGMGMLFVTHDMGVVASVADRVGVFYAGSIVEDGPVVDVFRRPLHPYTSGLLGSVPGLTQGRLRAIEGETPDLFEVEPGCRFSDRCPHVIDRCWSEKPPVRVVGATRVACHRSGELELPGVG